MPDLEHIRQYCEKVKERLGHFTVGFVRVKVEAAEENLLGSGTLVCFKERFAILTAAHVIEELKKTHEIGLCVDVNAHRLTIPTDHLNIICVGWSGRTTDRGPDLALVELPATCIATLKARKSFYELSQVLDVNYNAGIFLSALIGEWTEVGPSEAGFSGTKSFGMLCGGVGRVERYWRHAGFDFCTISVQCHRDNPKNYQGASGGGLWKVIASSSDIQDHEVRDVLLCGVAYWQTELIDDKRSIYCHGYRSIYINALNALS